MEQPVQTFQTFGFKDGMRLEELLSSWKAFKPVDYTTLSDEELLQVLKTSKDFDKLVFPNAWYSKFELPEKSCRNMKEFLKESPWMRTAHHWYIGKEEIPAKPGGLRPILPAEEVPVKVVPINAYSDGPAGTLSIEELINQTESSNQPTTQQS